jgi:histidinol dehydrogenase
MQGIRLESVGRTLLGQAEHGLNSSAIFFTTPGELARATILEI